MKRILPIAYSLLILSWTWGQNQQQPYIVSPLLGPQIDAYELVSYGFHHRFALDKATLDYAVMYEVQAGDLYILRVFTLAEGEREIPLSPAQLQELQVAINRRGAPILRPLTEISVNLNRGHLAKVRVALETGSVVVGTVQQLADDLLLLDSDLGEQALRIEDIASLDILDHQIDLGRNYTFTNPNSTRYLFAPSAIPLEKGEGYYQNVWVVLHMASYGLTDRLTVTGGVEMISTLASIFVSDYFGPIGMMNLKYAGPVGNKLHLGGGILAGGGLGQDLEGVNLGLAYGVATLGNVENNLTLGYGFGRVGEEWTRPGVLMVGGMARINRRMAFVSENWLGFVTDRYYMGLNEYGYWDRYDTYQEGFTEVRRAQVLFAFSGGLRIMTEKNTFDLALVALGNHINQNGPYPRNTTEWVPIPVPYLDFVYRF